MKGPCELESYLKDMDIVVDRKPPSRTTSEERRKPLGEKEGGRLTYVRRRIISYLRPMGILYTTTLL